MLFVVAAALVDGDGRVLLTQRPAHKPMPGLWEFPGGKVSAHESPEMALVRELKEELGITTSTGCIAPAAFVTYPLNPDSRQPDIYTEGCGGCDPLAENTIIAQSDMLLMLLYVCRKWHGIPASHEGQAMKWVKPRDMHDYPMPPADVPLVAKLRDLL